MKKINKTLQAAKVSRRSVLKGAAATGAAAAIGPYYVPNAFAAPVVNVLMWGEYLPDSVVADFKAKTGITVNHTKIGDNGEIISKMKAGGVFMPSMTMVQSKGCGAVANNRRKKTKLS